MERYTGLPKSFGGNTLRSPRSATTAPGSGRVRKTGSTGDPPVPLGDPPSGRATRLLPKCMPVLTGSARATCSARRVAGRYRPVACSTQKRISGHALRRSLEYLKGLPFHLVSEQNPDRFLTALAGKHVAPGPQNQAFNAILFLKLESAAPLKHTLGGHESARKTRTGYRQAFPRGVWRIGAVVRCGAKPQVGPTNRGGCSKRQAARSL